MQSITLSTLLSLLITSSSLANPVPSPEIASPLGGYTSSCTILSADGQYLTASCGNGKGVSTVSTVDLNQCLGNENGVLVIPSSGFISSCFSVTWNGATMCTCCNNFQGVCQNQCADTNNLVTNRDGVLTCP